MSETKGIYQRLREAQLQLKAPKSEDGRFGKSRSAELILEHAKPVLDKHGLTLVVTDEIIFVEDRHYVKATATVYDEKGESVSATAHAWEGTVDRGLDASQVTGKTSSYARKYALGGLLAIDDTKDADTREHEQLPKTKPAVGKAQQPDAMTQAQLKKMQAMFNELGVKERDEKLTYIGDVIGKPVESSKDLTKTAAGNVINQLQNDLDLINGNSDDEAEGEI